MCANSPDACSITTPQCVGVSSTWESVPDTSDFPPGQEAPRRTNTFRSRAHLLERYDVRVLQTSVVDDFPSDFARHLQLVQAAFSMCRMHFLLHARLSVTPAEVTHVLASHVLDGDELLGLQVALQEGGAIASRSKLPNLHRARRCQISVSAADTHGWRLAKQAGEAAIRGPTSVPVHLPFRTHRLGRR